MEKVLLLSFRLHQFVIRVADQANGDYCRWKTEKLMVMPIERGNLSELCFPHFQNTVVWSDRFSSAWLLASTWCSQSKLFENYSIQDICLNWNISLSMYLKFVFLY